MARKYGKSRPNKTRKSNTDVEAELASIRSSMGGGTRIKGTAGDWETRKPVAKSDGEYGWVKDGARVVGVSGGPRSRIKGYITGIAGNPTKDDGKKRINVKWDDGPTKWTNYKMIEEVRSTQDVITSSDNLMEKLRKARLRMEGKEDTAPPPRKPDPVRTKSEKIRQIGSLDDYMPDAARERNLGVKAPSKPKPSSNQSKLDGLDAYMPTRSARGGAKAQKDPTSKFAVGDKVVESPEYSLHSSKTFLPIGEAGTVFKV